MANKNELYEIISNLTDKEILRTDLSEIAEVMRRMLTEKYLDRINAILRQQHQNSLSNPSNSMRLLVAMKPFMREESHERIDQIVQSMAFVETMQTIFTSVSGNALAADADFALDFDSDSNINRDTDSIHDDGVYDLDKNCLAKKREHKTISRNRKTII